MRGEVWEIRLMILEQQHRPALFNFLKISISLRESPPFSAYLRVTD
jgi:hypothetical protein